MAVDTKALRYLGAVRDVPLIVEAADEIDQLRAAVKAAHEVIKATGVDRDAVCEAWQSAYAAVKEGL